MAVEITKDDLDKILDLIPSILIEEWKKNHAMTRQHLLTECKKRLPKPVCDCPHLDLHIAKYLEHMMQTGCVQRLSKAGNSYYAPGEKYVESVKIVGRVRK